MANDSHSSRHELAQYHSCVHCGSIFRRDAFDSTAVTTGIYPCSKCGNEGPLNIVIRDVDATVIGTTEPAPGSSAG